MAPTTGGRSGALPLTGIAVFTSGLTGLRAGLLSFLIGLMGSFGQAPFHLWPLTMAMLTVFVWQLDGAAAARRPRLAGFWRGWCLGFGYFLAGMWWVSSAFLVDADRYAALIPLAVTVMPAGLALFWGAVGFVAVWLWRRDWRRIVLLATVFFVFEYVRGHVLTGFPWNLAGQVWAAGGAISQTASIVGVYGLTLITLVAFMAPATLVSPSKRIAASLTPPIAALVVFVVLFAGGHARLLAASDATVPGVRLRIVQAQIDQREKYVDGNQGMVRDHYLRLSTKPGIETRTHIIWAESALPVRLLEEPRLLDSIARTLGDGRVLLTGLVRLDVSDPTEPRFYNSLGAISIERGLPVVAAIYDKVKLVPFGEYLPLRSAIRPIVPLIDAFGGDFTHGPGKVTLTAPNAPPFAPQICYEVIFPGFTPRGAERPGWIVNVTNDSWYEDTPGPYQLYNQARYRAIEEGMPLARAASGGVSAVVDPYGRAVAELQDDADDVVDADLPAAVRAPLYALLGDAPAYLLALAGLFVGLARSRGRP